MSHGRPIHESFTFADLGRVYWPSTVKLALCRGFCSGLVWAAVISLVPDPTPHAEMFLLIVPLVWMFFAGLVGLALSLSSIIVPIVGSWLNLLGALFICVGDPLVYVVNRVWPGVLNIADLRLFNFRPLIFVLLPD